MDIEPGHIPTPSSTPAAAMGNSSAKSLKDRNKIKSSIHRFIGYVYDEDPDVETLRIPFNVARDIFLRLSLADLFNCMLVCKEWRSLIDTCSFWEEYLESNFDFSVTESKRTSPLYAWKYGASRTSLFSPFPDVWRCGIVVPYAMTPARGCLDIHHAFIAALLWLGQLQSQLEVMKVDGVMEVCLLPWLNDRMPESGEVIALLGGHPSLLTGTPDAKPFTKQEMKHYLSIMNGRYSDSQFDATLYRWIADKVWDRVILFDCNRNVGQPPPSFIITRLAPGWVGGLMYTC